MSWFDSAGIASFAKSAKTALKEAQKTIDKALDIQEEENSNSSTSPPAATTVDLKEKSEDFFASFGLSEKNTSESNENLEDKTDQKSLINEESGAKDSGTNKMVTSLWGSFTGSFFENKSSASTEGAEEGVKSTSVPSTPSKDIVATQPPRSKSGLPNILSEQKCMTRPPESIGIITDYSTAEETELKDIHIESESRNEDWYWKWDNSVMTMSSDPSITAHNSNLDLDIRDEALADDTLDTDGFSKSRLVVGSVDSDMGCLQRSESLGSLSNKSMDNDPISEQGELEDPFQDQKESISLPIHDLSEANTFSGDFITDVQTPDSIVVLESYGVEDPKIPLNLSSPLSSPDSIEVLGSGSVTSPSFEVLSGTSCEASPIKNENPITLLEDNPSFDYPRGNHPAKPPITREPDATFSPEKETTEITITKQPLSALKSLCDSDSTSIVEDISTSTSESIQSTSTSSTHTVIEGTMQTVLEQRSGGILDGLTSVEFSSSRQVLEDSIKVTPEACDKNIKESTIKPHLEEVHKSILDSKNSTSDGKQISLTADGKQVQSSSDGKHIPIIARQDIDRNIDVEDFEDSDTLTTSVTTSSITSMCALPLDVSMESGGSSDTITTSVDSVNMLWASRSHGGSESEGRDTVPSETGSGKSIVVRNLLEEAMGDAEEPQYLETSTKQEDQKLTEREQSSSSSDRSDILKVSSGPTSSHSSGDEIETTTSSDIEVISSPSLDGSLCVVRSLSANHPNWAALTRSQKGSNAERSESPASDSSSSKKINNNGNNGHEAIPSSMTTSFTSISESEGDIGHGNRLSSFGAETSRMAHDLLKEISYFEKGHRRNQSNFSETSESSSEPQTPEVEKLLKKISRLTEVLEARENKVLELSRQVSMLEDTNMNLKMRTEELDRSSGASDIAESIREEYTQRLVTMERKFQQALREKETMKKQLEELRIEAASRPSTSEVTREMEERDTIIKELREEGEKLSKQQLTYSTTIKKLRGKEKENETTIKTQKTKLEEQSRDLERLRKQLSAKEEVERKQIEAIRQLTVTNQQQEIHFKDTTADNAELEEKMKALKDALDCAYKEVAELKRAAAANDAKVNQQLLSTEVAERERAEATLSEFKLQSKREQETLYAQIQDLEDTLARTEQQLIRKERNFNAEIKDLQDRLCEADSRTEELSSAVSAATKPLLRQLETLQSTHATQQASWDSLELNLSKRLSDSQALAAASVERERVTKELYATTAAENSGLQTKIVNLKSINSKLTSQYELMKSKLQELEEAKSKGSTQIEALKSSFAEEIHEVKRERDSLEQLLDMEKTALSAEKKKSAALQDQIKERDKRIAHMSAAAACNMPPSHQSTPRSSPTPSLSRLSLPGSMNDSISGSQWGDEVFDNNWHAVANRPSLYDSLRGNSAVTVDALTSQLRQREGELALLQSEITRHETQRESLAQELVSVTSQLDEANTKLLDKDAIQEKYNEMERQYNALLQMYGEKVEEVEELRLDLSDVKDMYKAQIDQLLQK